MYLTRIREFDVATGTASQWLCNFVRSLITQHAVANMEWRTLRIFCIFNWALPAYLWVSLREMSDFLLLLTKIPSLLMISLRAEMESDHSLESHNLCLVESKKHFMPKQPSAKLKRSQWSRSGDSKASKKGHNSIKFP